MPRDLFGDVSDPRVRVGSRKWYTVPLSLFVHTLVLLLVVVIPLVATGALPDPRSVIVTCPLCRGRFRCRRQVRRVEAMTKPDGNPGRRADRSAASTSRRNHIDSGFEMRRDRRGRCSGRQRRRRITRRDRSATAAAAGQTAGARADWRHHSRTGADPVRRPDVSAHRASRRGSQGVVIIEATIGVDGRVINARMLRSSADARRGGARGGSAVDLHADDAQRHPGASHHDGHRELSAPEVRSPCDCRAISTSRR